MTDTLLILLPPSETKSEGGSRSFPEVHAPSPEIAAVRAQTLADLVHLSEGDPAAAARALKLPATKAEAELERNRALARAPRKPAVERYTGVLYDALDASGLDPASRAWLAEHVWIHSALYGFVTAEEGIAAYRCSHDARLPGETLKRRWRDVLSAQLAAHRGPILDLRSRGYVELGPLPNGPERAWADVRERRADGSTRSLNHFNKRTKGLIVRRLAEQRAELTSLDDLATALTGLVAVEPLGSGTLALTVEVA